MGNQEEFVKKFVETGRSKGYTDDEIKAKLPKALEDFKSIPTMSTSQPKESFLEQAAPTGMSAVGGVVAGSLGSGLGFSIGDSFREIAKQNRQGAQEGLSSTDATADIYGRLSGSKLTDFGQQRAEETGLNKGSNATTEMLKQLMQKGQKVTDQPEFSYKQAKRENIADPKNQKEAAKFVVTNIIKSTLVGLTDAVVNKISSKILNKILPKISSKFNVEGLTPKKIASNSDKLAEETWKPIQETLEETTKSGGRVDVTDAVEKIQEKMVEVISTDDIGKMSANNKAMIKAYEKVLKELTDASTLSNGRYTLNPKSAQSFTEYTGKAVSAGKGVSLSTAQSSENTAKKIVGEPIRDNLIEFLSKNGLKNADEMYKDYGIYKDLSNKINRPLSGALNASMLGTSTGTATALLGGPGAAVGSAATMGAMGVMTPIGGQVARGVIKAPAKMAPGVSKVTTPALYDFLTKGNK